MSINKSDLAAISKDFFLASEGSEIRQERHNIKIKEILDGVVPWEDRTVAATVMKNKMDRRESTVDEVICLGGLLAIAFNSTDKFKEIARSLLLPRAIDAEVSQAFADIGEPEWAKLCAPEGFEPVLKRDENGQIDPLANFHRLFDDVIYRAQFPRLAK